MKFKLKHIMALISLWNVFSTYAEELAQEKESIFQTKQSELIIKGVYIYCCCLAAQSGSD